MIHALDQIAEPEPKQSARLERGLNAFKSSVRYFLGLIPH
ncbi:hypothetical protein VIBNISO65_1110075 [Vibrio nigripulchritudo SO65]|nr:hypothetical protein VIBNIAM115_1260033 [Vibrio nigripulchritudo AM115]CCN41911.1 hypothetical protein VIBNIFTn2_210162 [Vibrio nigripulchritudo FTn2]CCN66296.1 hypothetical protein VIBNIPon4_530081 [Vibrio nigripulchritudo POn4]CCN74653.1 hypothetical protein VIBNISO65_1110075 [Vibrio nigripulchritudo SO65]